MDHILDTYYSGHIVLCGLDQLGLRILEELRRLGEDVVVVAKSPPDEFASEALSLGARLLDGDAHKESVLRSAGIDAANAFVITGNDDSDNLHIALAAQELNPRLRIVISLFSRELGSKIHTLFRDCSVLSAPAIAAPAFVAAALHEDWQQRITVAGRPLVIRQASARDPDVLLPLARETVDGADELFPSNGDGLLCLKHGGSDRGGDHGWDTAHGRRRLGIRRLLGPMLQLLSADPRLRLLLGLLAALAGVSVVIFRFWSGLDLITSFYFTVTVITTTGFGDISLLHAPGLVKLFGSFLMLVGAAALALTYALITDAIVTARLARHAAAARELSDHIVVCGLGNVGYTVVEAITRLGVPVAATEIDEEDPFLPSAHSLGVPVLLGDARLPETLEALNIASARCVVAATNDDMANLETALNALSLNPDIRVVLRLFDPDFAERVERAFGVHISRSVSSLAAPAFAAAAVGEQVIATVPVGVQALIIASAVVE
ncbi:MAG: NAD-binding protein, partial [Chloroflexota bacterium]|nr:NAD-binding protein [Chloroflexota bacterium]